MKAWNETENKKTMHICDSFKFADDVVKRRKSIKINPIILFILYSHITNVSR